MENEELSKIEHITLIAGRKQKDEIVNALSEVGVKLIDIIYGKGTVKAGYLQELLGLAPEENKVVITGLLSSDKTDLVFNMLVEKFNFDKPNTGIAYVHQIEKLSF